jgi:membrane-associated phospholipid phosphatase
VVHLGDPLTVTTLAGLLLLACLATRRWRGAALVAVAAPAATGLTKILLQPLIHRTLTGGVSFPSGHATGAFVLAAMFAVLLVNPGRPAIRVGVRAALAVVAVLAALLVAVALVALDFHYATDTVAGGAVAIAVVLLAALVIDLLPEPGRRKIDATDEMPWQPSNANPSHY